MDIGKWCRICSIEVKYGVFLFSEEAKRSFLHAKIRKYLSVSISLEDKLPKMICEDCILKIDGFHKFATMALKNQDKMTRCILSTPVSPEPTKTENVSLLHTYLTKGSVDKHLQNNETEVMEMEVRVDPMSILQCCLEDSESDNEIDVNNKSYEHDSYEKEEPDQDDEESDDEGLSDQETALDNTDNMSSESENSENTCIIYLCSICKKSFATNYDLQDHMYIHSTTYTKRILSLSLNKHQENLTFSVVNGKMNNQNHDETSGLEINQSMEDEKIEPGSKEDGNATYKCPICARGIPSRGALKVHLETHRPKGQYGCDICGRVFKTQCNLFRHKEYHQGIQFPCEVCGRVYPTNSTLRAHAITHSDLRPHKCPLCDKTFKRNQDLKFHINQHTGARPYQCPYCPKAFASSGNCFSHRKRMHPLEVERDRERAAKIMR